MSVATEHLAHDALAVLVEIRREVAGLSNPFVGSISSITIGKLRASMGQGRAGHLGRRKGDRVVDLAHDPPLDAIDEFWRGNLGRLVVHEPGICSARKTACQMSEAIRNQISGTYFPAVMAGQVASLQMGRPVLVLVSWMT